VTSSPTPVTAVAVPRHHRTLWWKEALIVAVFYTTYTLIRNRFGSAFVNGADIPLHSFTNAVRVIRIERALGLYTKNRFKIFSCRKFGSSKP